MPVARGVTEGAEDVASAEPVSRDRQQGKCPTEIAVITSTRRLGEYVEGLREKDVEHFSVFALDVHRPDSLPDWGRADELFRDTARWRPSIDECRLDP